MLLGSSRVLRSANQDENEDISLMISTYRFVNTRPKLFELEIFLQCEVSDGVTLLSELCAQVLTVQKSDIGVPETRKTIRLVLEHLHLAFKTSSIILTRTLEVVVHPLNICHEIGQM